MTLFFIVNCSLVSRTISLVISIDVVYDLVLLIPVCNVVVGVFRFVGTAILYVLLLRRMIVSSITFAFSAHVRVQIIEGIGSSPGITVLL